MDLYRRRQKDAGSLEQMKSAIVLIGNMHVGKSSLFSRLVGNRGVKTVFVDDHPVPVNSGLVRGLELDVLDTPGICSIFTNNEDERISRDILIPDMTGYDIQGVVIIMDAKNLKRSISIVLQYAEFRLPMVLAINMIDEASPRGIKIDKNSLSKILGIDVVTTVARDGIGVRKLKSNLKSMKVAKPLIQYPDWVEQFIEAVGKLLKPSEISTRAFGILLLSEDRGVHRYIEKQFGKGMLEQLKDLAEEYRKGNALAYSMLLTNTYAKKAEEIAAQVQRVDPKSKNMSLINLGNWCTQPSTGIPIAMGVLFLMYLFVGLFGATFLVDQINGGLFGGFLIPWTKNLIEPIPNEFIKELIIDPDFGILPTGVFLAIGLVLPVLFCFYVAFSILDDSGYLPRLSILLDKLLHKMGLNGKGVIPLIMGFSCVTMAILTTRMLDTKKERIIATFLLILGMPCAPLLAVMLVLLGQMPFSASATVFGLIIFQMFFAGYVLNKILPGRRTSFLMEIPAMRVPNILQIVKMSARKTFFFMKEAIPVFIFASVIVFLFERVGGLDLLENISKPVISGFMGLPEKSVQVFIKTLIRRENGATEIEHLSTIYTNLQIVVNLLVMTFLSPCMNAIIVLIKERGGKIALLIMVTVLVYAVLIGSLVNHLCRFLGVTFT
jgi:ferrous iron transport protein B